MMVIIGMPFALLFVRLTRSVKNKLRVGRPALAGVPPKICAVYG